MLDSVYGFIIVSKKIEFQFDEFIQIKDINNQLIISPSMEKFPEITFICNQDFGLITAEFEFPHKVGDAVSCRHEFHVDHF